MHIVCYVDLFSTLIKFARFYYKLHFWTNKQFEDVILQIVTPDESTMNYEKPKQQMGTIMEITEKKEIYVPGTPTQLLANEQGT